MLFQSGKLPNMSNLNAMNKTLYDQLRNDLALCFGGDTSMNLHRAIVERLQFITNISKLSADLNSSVTRQLETLTEEATQ